MNLLHNDTLRAYVIAIGRDFDNYGGDIPTAISQIFFCNTNQSKGWRGRQAWCVAKIFNATDAPKRYRVVMGASLSLRLAIDHDDWLIDVLAAYYGGVKGYESARDRAVRAYRNAAQQMSEAPDNLWVTYRLMWRMTRRTLLGAVKGELPMSAFWASFGLAWANITGKSAKSQEGQTPA